MRLGVHLSTFTKTWDEDVFQYIKVAAQIGYDGVEFPLLDSKQFDRQKAKRLLKENHLMCTCGTGINPNTDISSINTDIRQNGIEHLRGCIDICNELETDCLGGVLYAPWGMKKPRAQARDNSKFSMEVLYQMGEYAKQKGVTLALEILNRYESSFLNTVEEGNQMLEQIGSDNIKLHFDTFHAHIEEKDIAKAITDGAKNIYHVHFCENNRGVPGTGQIDWKLVMNALNTIGYDRWLTLENFVMSNSEVGNDVCIWRQIEDTGKIAAQKGFAYMNQLVNK